VGHTNYKVQKIALQNVASINSFEGTVALDVLTPGFADPKTSCRVGPDLDGSRQTFPTHTRSGLGPDDGQMSRAKSANAMTLQ
jgi:hypothetical protein